MTAIIVKIYKNVIHGLSNGWQLIKRVKHIFMHLYSESPTKEIKQNWIIFLIGGLFVILMTILSGMPFMFNIKFVLPFNEFFNNNGGFIFVIFVIFFCITVISKKQKS